MTVSEPRQVVGPDVDMPEGIDILHSNNCLSIATYQDSLYIAWRSAPMHFASKKTKIFIMSSQNDGLVWTKEHEIELGSDAREPYLVEIAGKLYFYFF